jgi:hypothetical protein
MRGNVREATHPNTLPRSGRRKRATHAAHVLQLRELSSEALARVDGVWVVRTQTLFDLSARGDATTRLTGTVCSLEQAREVFETNRNFRMIRPKVRLVDRQRAAK